MSQSSVTIVAYKRHTKLLFPLDCLWTDSSVELIKDSEPVIGYTSWIAFLSGKTLSRWYVQRDLFPFHFISPRSLALIFLIRFLNPRITRFNIIISQNNKKFSKFSLAELIDIFVTRKSTMIQDSLLISDFCPT